MSPNPLGTITPPATNSSSLYSSTARCCVCVCVLALQANWTAMIVVCHLYANLFCLSVCLCKERDLFHLILHDPSHYQ